VKDVATTAAEGTADAAATVDVDADATGTAATAATAAADAKDEVTGGAAGAPASCPRCSKSHA